MSGALPHLLVVPIVLPLLAAVVMLLVGDGRRRLKSLVNVGATLAALLVALEILRRVGAARGPAAIGVYLAANWEVPFGIVLVADRLSALMLTLTGVVSLGAAVYSMAGWSRAGVYFQPLFQIQLMGLNGAFLTGDLFNLFVFFEVTLTASYGLLLHGSGWARVRSGLHYIAVNLLASTLFLIGLALLYGVVGSLSMADIAAKLPQVADTDRSLLHVGAAVLAVAFLTKAAIWPLGFWLVPAYTAASAPVAALFALMTKLGIYALLRVWTLLFSAGTASPAPFGANAFLYGGIATITFGVLGLIATLRLGRIAGFSIIVSAGTLLTAIGLGQTAVTAAALFYLLSASIAGSALFLLVELVERTSKGDRMPLPDVDLAPGEDTNLDDDETPLVGRAFPVSLALLGMAYIACALIVAGVPPLSGFIAKVALLTALLNPGGLGASNAVVPNAFWLFGLLLLSGLAAVVSMSRAGIRHFWSAADRRQPGLKVDEGAPVVLLILVCAWLTVDAERVMRYTSAAAEELYSPATYFAAVLAAQPVPGPMRPVSDGEGAP